MDPALLNAAERNELDARIHKRAVEQLISYYNSAVGNCFTACIDQFQSKKISGTEETCLKNCVQKTVESTQRLRDRFAENHTADAQGGLPK